MKKWLPVTAWVVSDWVTLLQLGWLKSVFPGVYNGIMDFVSPISMKLHTVCIASWAVVKEVAVSAFANTS